MVNRVCADEMNFFDTITQLGRIEAEYGTVNFTFIRNSVFQMMKKLCNAIYSL
mgnify:FL=1